MTEQTTPTDSTTAAPEKYTSEEIQVLEGLEAIRKRPGMYVGGTGLNALHHLVYECVDNAIDEAMAGFATSVDVRIGVDGSCTVSDDGRGMPVDPMKHENPKINGRPAVEVILTEVHAGGKFDNNAYKVSGGLHGVGVKCVNALSEWTEVIVRKAGVQWSIGFERGKVTHPLHQVRADLPTAERGTTIRFLPDTQIFPDTNFRFETLEFRLRELAYLNPGVKIRLVDERVDASGRVRDVVFHDQDGIRAYVQFLNSGRTTVSSCIGISRVDESRGLRADLALQYTDGTNENLLAFGNNIRNPDGGTHVVGFKTALTRVINGYAREKGLIKDLVPTGDDLREGLTAVISVKLPNPQFNNQTKEKLLNEEIEGFVSQAVGEELAAWLDRNPAEAKKICQRAVLAAEAREAARRARDLIRRKSALGDNALPQKLADCSSNDVERTEIFIVEGDSAGGSAKGGRDHVHQAILPLRGKLLNVERCRLDKVLAFEEIQTLIQALQCGIADELDPAKLRYGRIIIMTDADVDGSHIRTLLLTFFFRQMQELVRQGRIYIAQPPLYRVSRGKTGQYVLNDKQMSDTLAGLALKRAVLVVRAANGSIERTIEGDALQRVLRQLHRLDELVTVSKRRGIVFPRLLAERANDPTGHGHLPRYLVSWGGGDALCWTEADAARVAQERSLPAESMRELHENSELERLFGQLAQSGLDIADFGLVQEESVTGEKLSTRYGWLLRAEKGAKAKADDAAPAADADEDGDGEPKQAVGGGRANTKSDPSKDELVEVANIPGILHTLHDVGRRGIEVQRFKGLGEMEAVQLWETTMDPARRTLLRVSMEAAAECDRLFHVLMGEDVEQRRAYIEKHALEVKNLDV
jgi:DNA gyrase subunit B